MTSLLTAHRCRIMFGAAYHSFCTFQSVENKEKKQPLAAALSSYPQTVSHWFLMLSSPERMTITKEIRRMRTLRLQRASNNAAVSVWAAWGRSREAASFANIIVFFHSFCILNLMYMELLQLKGLVAISN